MATKREIREQNELNTTNPEKELEDTMQLDTEEVRKADEDGIQIPDFANTFYDERPYSEKLRPEHEKKEPEEEKPSRKPIIVGVAVFLLCLTASFGMIAAKKNKTVKDEAPAATVAPSSPAETPEAGTAEETSSPSESGGLDYYYMQQARTAIIAKLNDEFGTDYTKPSAEQYRVVDGGYLNPVIEFDVTVGDAFKKNYVMPAHFELKWDSEEGCYLVSVCSIDEEEAVKSGFKSHSSKKEAKKQAEKVSTGGKEVSNFTVEVTNSVTVTITSKGEGDVTAYAESEDGTRTELATANNTTVTKTVDLESGRYRLVLYAADGTGYSWNYELG